MKNSNLKYVLFIIVLVIIISAIVYFYTSNKNKDTNKDTNKNNMNSQANTTTSASKTSTNVNMENNRIANIIAENTPVVPKETQISTYSTAIKDNSSGRLVNIRLTCNALNGTIINPNDTFSFNRVVGKPTAEKGYQEAKIIIDHKTETGIGGGNCQVSSTLYNAVLGVPTLEVKERHEHGKDVTYVSKGKDAAVSYGSLDFKFKNNNNYKIKINIASDDQNITATLMKVE